MRKGSLLIGVALLFSGALVAQDNLISNYTFETDLQGWNIRQGTGSGYTCNLTWDGAVSQDGASSGSAKVELTGNIHAKDLFVMGMKSDLISVTSGESYVYSGWMKTLQDDKILALRVDYNSGSEVTAYQGSGAKDEQTLSITDGWKQFTKTFTPTVIPDGKTGAGDDVKNVRIVIGGGTTAGDFYFDNVSLIQQSATAIGDVTIEKLNVSVAPDGSKLGFIGKDRGAVHIYSVSGRLVKETILNGNAINISDLSKGMYIVKLDNLTTKFVK